MSGRRRRELCSYQLYRATTTPIANTFVSVHLTVGGTDAQDARQQENTWAVTSCRMPIILEKNRFTAISYQDLVSLGVLKEKHLVFDLGGNYKDRLDNGILCLNT